MDGSGSCRSFTCAGGNNATLCGVLGDLYYATHGASWAMKNGWVGATTSAVDYCTFTGATCSGGALTSVNLNNNGLAGALQRSFLLLGPTTTCNVGGASNNALFFDFSLLPLMVPSTATNITFCADSWCITSSGDFQKRNTLDASVTSWLSTDRMLFNGTFPDLSSLTSLTSVQMSDFLNPANGVVSGTLPDMFAPLTALTSFDIHNNGITGVLPPSAFTRCSTSASCVFQNTNILLDYSALDASTTQAVSITSTSAPWNLPAMQFSLQGFANFTALTSLVISNQGSGLSGAIPDMFGGMAALTSLDLSGNALTGTLPPSVIAVCSKQGASCNFGGGSNAISSTVAAFASRLQANSTSFAINAQGVSISGTIPSLASFTALTSISLSQSGLTGTIPDVFGHMSALTSLDLSNNALTGTLPPSAAAVCLKQGVSCKFGGGSNAISATVADFASQLQANTTSFAINAQGVSLSGTIPNLASFTALTSINLGGCGLTGTIPATLASLTNLRYLYLPYSLSLLRVGTCESWPGHF